MATEEYLVKTVEEPCFMLWQNEPSVIIGKHQNPLREINLHFLEKHQIPMLRRISGGGTVFHDLGNVNYSFIDLGKADSLVNFARYSAPILKYLNSLGVDAQLVGKSDLMIGGKKFSGNASHVYRNKVLHHGTLLFNSNLDFLSQSLLNSGKNIADKAVNSNRSTVTNISDHLHLPMNVGDFIQSLTGFIRNEFPKCTDYQLTTSQLDEIEMLAETKYKTWEWNFGYSPNYEISSTLEYNSKTIEIKTTVVKGRIQQIYSSNDLSTELNHLFALLYNVIHDKETVVELLKDKASPKNLEIILKILF
jgi:lipoate-protein ligase A